MHRPDVVGRVTPVPLGIQVPEPQLGLETAGYPGGAHGHLAGHEAGPAARRLMVVEDGVDGEDPPGRAGSAGPSGGRTPWPPRRGTPGRAGSPRPGARLAAPPKISALEACSRRIPGSALPDGLEQPEHPEPGHVGDGDRVSEGVGHRGGGGQVVDLRRPGLRQRRQQRPASLRVPSRRRTAGGTASGTSFAGDTTPVHLVARGEQDRAEVGAVLPGDPGDERAAAGGGHRPTVAASADARGRWAGARGRWRVPGRRGA